MNFDTTKPGRWVTMNGAKVFIKDGDTPFTGGNIPVFQTKSPAPESRKSIVDKAKELGLPATGPTAEIGELVSIATKPSRDWTLEEFKTILPYLAVQQVMGTGKNIDEIIISIQQQGINRGMVDSLYDMVTGEHWTWARGLKGDAVVVIRGSIKHNAPTSAFIKSSGKPVSVIRNSELIKAGDLQGFYKAVTGK